MTNETFAALLPMCDEIHPMFSLFFHCLGQEFYKLRGLPIKSDWGGQIVGPYP